MKITIYLLWDVTGGFTCVHNFVEESYFWEMLTAMKPHPVSSGSASERRRNNFEGLLPEIQGRNIALTVLYMPHSLASGILNLISFWL